MDFKSLVRFIRAQGCKVKVCNKKTIEDVLGYFVEEPTPCIKIAVKGKSKREIVSVLLHEYGHFCQWRDGFSQYLDGICWAYNLHEEWLKEEIELTELEIQMIRATMLSIEYDAELRALKWGDELKVKNFSSDYHLKEAQSYMAAIKWSFDKRSSWNKRASWKNYPAKRLTYKELFAPLTRKQKKILKKMKV